MVKDVTVAIIGAVATILAAYLGTKTPQTSPQAGRPLATKAGRQLVVGVVVLVAVVLAVGVAFGIAEERRHRGLQNQATAGELVKSYSNLIVRGLDAGKPYVMPSVLMLITLEATPDGRSISSDRRTFYSVQALLPIKSDAGTFAEEYHSDWPVQQIAGSDEEHVIDYVPSKLSMNVKFDIPKGERHTLLTGAHVSMPMDLPPRDPVHMYENLGKNDDAFCYPNEANDVIEELVIVVQSTSLKLSLPGDPDRDAALATLQNTHVTYLKPEVLVPRKNPTQPSTIVARFSNIPPQYVAGLHVQWEKPQASTHTASHRANGGN